MFMILKYLFALKLLIILYLPEDVPVWLIGS